METEPIASSDPVTMNSDATTAAPDAIRSLRLVPDAPPVDELSAKERKDSLLPAVKQEIKQEEVVEEVKKEAVDEVISSPTISNQQEEENKEALYDNIKKEAFDEEEPDDDEGGNTEREEEDEDPATLRDVFQCMDDLLPPGSTCTGGLASELPVLPGLKVQGVGIVALPVTEITAAALKTIAQQAPHEKGSQTMEDRKVRETWQIDANQVSLTHPAWNNNIAKIVHTAITVLGVAPSMVETHLHKLLLHETGGFVQKYRDTEKEKDGMFATLVIQLPSIFEGGSFVISHNEKQKEFKLDDTASAPYSCQYVAYYADCEHEVMPVTSGYRLALVYSLCYKGNKFEAPSARMFEMTSPMVQVMERLPLEDSLFAILLDDQYTAESLAQLGVSALHEKDRALASTIARADGWKVIIAQLQRLDEERGSHCYDGDFHVHDTEEGYLEFENMYYEDGSSAYGHCTWISDQLELTSVEAGGIILASKEKLECMWEEESIGTVEYIGHGTASREVTYSTGLLIAFRDAGLFERICHADISSGVDEVVNDSRLLPPLLEFLKRNQPIISYADFGTVYPMLASSGQDKWQSFGILMSCLNGGAIPTPEVAAIFASLVKEHGWNENTKPIFAILESISSVSNALQPSVLPDILNMLQLMDSVEKDGNVDGLFSKVVANYVALIVKGQGQSIWKSKDFVDFLFNRGKPCHFQSLHEWALKAPRATLSEVRSCLENTGPSSSTGAKETFLNVVEDCLKSLAIADLQQRKQKLKQSVRGGKPVFSWSMPGANTSNPQLDAFLHSDRQGPTEIIVGGNIRKARDLALSGSYFKSDPEYLLRTGYSADMVAQGVGQRASVVVTKTQAFFDAKVSKYENDCSELKSVREELRQLGVDSGEPACKRARTDVDVIVIE